jgi:hypothetical protein
MTDTTHLASASDSELDAVAERIQAERERRQAEDQTAQAARFQAELAEVRAGTRAAYPEHLPYLSPTETTALVERGQLTHLGIGRSKRRGQR